MKTTKLLVTSEDRDDFVIDDITMREVLSDGSLGEDILKIDPNTLGSDGWLKPII